MSVMCLVTLLQLQGLYTPGPGAYEVKPVEKHAPQVLHPFAHCKIHSRNSDMVTCGKFGGELRQVDPQNPGQETLLMLAWLQETSGNNQV